METGGDLLRDAWNLGIRRRVYKDLLKRDR